jgi:predicted phosphodiesterase
MPRLHVLSDLHLELRGPRWRTLVDAIPAGIADVLVLAGDVLRLDRAADAAAMLAALRAKAPHAVFVLGNHEYWHFTLPDAKARAAALCAQVDIAFLDASAVELAGARFLGGTLWFPRDPAAGAYRRFMTDFHLIEEFEDAVYDEHRRCVDFVDAHARTTDVVVTHHLPSYGSVAPEFRSGPNEPLNAFFVGDCEAVIARRRPALWIHGHTHVPCDYRLGDTRVLCNPVGYPGEGARGRLDLVVDV